MYTLKIVRAVNYEDNGSIVTEEKVYHKIGPKPEILHYLTSSTQGVPVAKVIAEGYDIYVYPNESAYLVNEQGKTLEIVNRAK